ncbi:MAG: hypothetical protein PHZ19_07965 [Candidatus Thermoplasmatota archaeon]|nr:hypothetical protein [Candidatus Thermoplasmatota archaeon]
MDYIYRGRQHPDFPGQRKRALLPPAFVADLGEWRFELTYYAYYDVYAQSFTILKKDQESRAGTVLWKEVQCQKHGIRELLRTIMLARCGWPDFAELEDILDWEVEQQQITFDAPEDWRPLRPRLPLWYPLGLPHG